MRISKTFWLILGIGISVIVVGVLGWVYLGQRGEQQRLENSLSDAQQTHSTLISQKGDLESQLTQSEIELAEAESLLDVVKVSFPESVESIEYGEALFDIADDCDLEITSLTASQPSDQEVESVTYSITSFEIVVESESASYSDKIIVNNMLDFIDTIATSEYFTDTTHFANATITLVNIQFPQGEEEGEPSATINLVIYGYQGE